MFGQIRWMLVLLAVSIAICGNLDLLIGVNYMSLEPEIILMLPHD